MSTFFLMCLEFFKTGLFAVGGGLATIPFLKELSIKYGWFTMQDLTTMIAVSESTPGPMGINMATYVGNTMFGFRGGVAATLSLTAPSIIVILIIAKMLQKFQDSKVVKGAFTGLRPAVVGFILAAVVDIYLTSVFSYSTFRQTGNVADLFNWTAIILFAVMLAVYLKFPKIHPIWIILASAAAGIVLRL
ncbi:MAG: chromate transporter [Eubacteriales bacterium]|jgi:chromate transporter